jgi:FKBP-type peptidyl-prolyl cis-trans isomerase
MKRLLGIFAITLVLFLSGCGPKEPPAPVVPEKTVEEQRRENYFGKEIAADPDIKWRPSGLGIKIITPGEGLTPQMNDRVRVHYIGKLKDGTVFDDSHPRGKPSDFPVNRLIPGWSASMPSLMPGGKGVFYIPPHLGYGGIRAGNIPPHSGLIFEVELIAVNPEVPPKD